MASDVTLLPGERNTIVSPLVSFVSRRVIVDQRVVVRGRRVPPKPQSAALLNLGATAGGHHDRERALSLVMTVG